MDPIPTHSMQKAGKALDMLPVYHRANTDWQTHTHTHTPVHSCGKFRISNPPDCVSVSCWKKPAYQQKAEPIWTGGGLTQNEAAAAARTCVVKVSQLDIGGDMKNLNEREGRTQRHGVERLLFILLEPSNQEMYQHCFRKVFKSQTVLRLVYVELKFH